MHVFFTVLLWALLALLILLLLVLFMPVGVSVRIAYDKPTVWLRVLCFKFMLYPQKPKKKKIIKNQAKEAQAEKQITQEITSREQKEAENTNSQSTQVFECENNTQSKEAEAKPNKKFNLSFEKVLAIINSAGGAIKIIFKGLFFTKIEIIYPVHNEDSAETAINFGKTQAYFSSIAAAAQNFVHLSFKRVQIIPDFNGEHKYKRYFYCNIWSVTFIMLVAAVYLFISLRREKIF